MSENNELNKDQLRADIRERVDKNRDVMEARANNLADTVGEASAAKYLAMHDRIDEMVRSIQVPPEETAKFVDAMYTAITHLTRPTWTGGPNTFNRQVELGNNGHVLGQEMRKAVAKAGGGAGPTETIPVTDLRIK